MDYKEVSSSLLKDKSRPSQVDSKEVNSATNTLSVLIFSKDPMNGYVSVSFVSTISFFVGGDVVVRLDYMLTYHFYCVF